MEVDTAQHAAVCGVARQALDDGAAARRLRPYAPCPPNLGSGCDSQARDEETFTKRRHLGAGGATAGLRERCRTARREAEPGTRRPQKCRQVRSAGGEWAKALRSWHQVPPLLYSLLRSEFGSFFRSSLVFGGRIVTSLLRSFYPALFPMSGSSLCVPKVPGAASTAV